MTSARLRITTHDSPSRDTEYQVRYRNEILATFHRRSAAEAYLVAMQAR